MMDNLNEFNKLKHYILVGIFFVLLTGTLLHFVYDWSGNNFIVGLFAPKSESTWEHMKLCFFPMLAYSFYMIKKAAHTYPCVTSAILYGTLLSTFLVPIIFYTYSGILGTHMLLLDLLTFTASVLISFFSVYRFSISCRLHSRKSLLRLLVVITAVCFIIFSCYTPDIGIFAEPSH